MTHLPKEFSTTKDSQDLQAAFDDALEVAATCNYLTADEIDACRQRVATALSDAIRTEAIALFSEEGFPKAFREEMRNMKNREGSIEDSYPCS